MLWLVFSCLAHLQRFSDKMDLERRLLVAHALLSSKTPNKTPRDKVASLGVFF